MKQKRPQPPAPQPKNQRGSAIIAAVGVVLIVVMVVAVVVASRQPPPGSPTPQQILTLDATTVMNLTKLPNAPALTGSAAQPYLDLSKMVDACADFDDKHRLQMHQHLTWILNPSEIPTDMMAIAFGTNPVGKLVYGMGSFAQNQWLLLDKKPGSCVVPIGKHINEMLTTLGQPTFKVFDS